LRFTRHARNKLRRLRRVDPNVSPAAVLRALLQPLRREYDDDGRAKITITIGTAELMVVVDEADRVIVSIWEVD
jgi:hypothetical protein